MSIKITFKVPSGINHTVCELSVELKDIGAVPKKGPIDCNKLNDQVAAFTSANLAAIVAAVEKPGGESTHQYHQVEVISTADGFGAERKKLLMDSAEEESKGVPVSIHGSGPAIRMPDLSTEKNRKRKYVSEAVSEAGARPFKAVKDNSDHGNQIRFSFKGYDAAVFFKVDSKSKTALYTALEKYSCRTGIPASVLHVIYRGRQVSIDHSSAEDIGLQDGDVIHVFPQLRGS